MLPMRLLAAASASASGRCAKVPMASMRRSKSYSDAGRALGLAAVSSVIGGLFSLVVFILAAPLSPDIALRFRPQAYFAPPLFALSLLASFRGTSATQNIP